MKFRAMDKINKDLEEQKLKTIFKQPLEIALCMIIVGIVGVTFTQVLFRYIFHLSLAWSEELARYLFLWLAALASAYAFKTRSHFALRFLVNRFGKSIQNVIGSLVAFIVSVFLVIFVWKALEYTVSMSNQISPSTRMSMAVPYSSAVVGGILMLYYVLRNWWSDIRTKGKEKNKTQ